MADRNGLRLIGILFAAVTFAVMSTTVLVVKGACRRKLYLEFRGFHALALNVNRRCAP